MSLISGNVTFYDNSINNSTDPTTIVGIPLFLDNSSNEGVIYSGTFSGNSINVGEVQSSATFVGLAVNSGAVAVATFSDSAVNLGDITNSGTFYGTAVNSGIVSIAVFTGNAVNLGVISGSGLFYGTAINSGVVSGNAIFADTTINNGTVQGNANFATGAANQGGTVVGNTGTYGDVAPKNGAYSDGYYINGSIDYYYNNSYPVKAQDNDLWYFYNAGNIVTAVTAAILINAIWYNVDNGVVNGPASGIRQAFLHWNSAEEGKWFDFTNSVIVYASGTLVAANGKYYNFDGVGGATLIFYTDNGVVYDSSNSVYTSYFDTCCTQLGCHDLLNGKVYQNGCWANSQICFAVSYSDNQSQQYNTYVLTCSCLVNDYCTCYYTVNDYDAEGNCIGNHQESCEVICGCHTELYSVCGGGGNYSDNGCICGYALINIISGSISNSCISGSRNFVYEYFDCNNGSLNSIQCGIQYLCDNTSSLCSCIRCNYCFQ